MPIRRRALAELIGTFWLVFTGCGSAVLAAAFPELGIGFLGVAFAFGLALMTMGYVIGPISGCHINPAVTLGLFFGRRFPAREVLSYVLAQLGGAILAGLLLYAIASGRNGFQLSEGFAANGYGANSPGGYTLGAALIAELVMTFMFVLIVLGATAKTAPAGFAPIAIGLALTLVHLVLIPVTNASVNPVRSTSQALFVGGEALAQLWLFWLAPLAGGMLAGVVYPLLARTEAGTEAQPPGASKEERPYVARISGKRT